MQADEIDKRARLRRMRLVATGVLGCLAVVYLLTHLAAPAPLWIELVQAMAEAGMVGGLADWFAVEALFRHPLGLPIPHTALLKRNQAGAARAVGRFVETYFLDPGLVSTRIHEVRLARRLADWLGDPRHAHLVAERCVEALRFLLARGAPDRLMSELRLLARDALAQGASAQQMSGALARMIKEGVRGEMVTGTLTLVRNAIDANRDTAGKLVEERSRWWIASTIDRRVANLLVDGVISFIDELAEEQSTLRNDFDAAFARIVDDLETDGTLTRTLEKGLAAFTDDIGFESLVGSIGGNLRDRLMDELQSRPERITALFAETIAGAAARLKADEAACMVFDDRLAAVSERIATDLRPAVGAFVSDVLAGWDSSLMIERFETEVGRDLQFIRINGALLGALIGGALFGLHLLLS